MINLKDMLPVFPWDKLSHYQWASWFCFAAAMVVMVLAFWPAHQPLGIACLLGALASMLTGYAAGKLGERSDEEVNAEAIASGNAAPHEVSDADARASFLGCLPSASPLLLAFVFSVVR